MQVQALRAFPYSIDGYTIRHAAKGEVVDIPDALVEGLVQDGFAKKDTGASSEDKMLRSAPENKGTAEPRSEQAAVEIPNNWRDLPWYELRSIAANVSDQPIRNKDDAVAAVERELERRKG